MWMKWFDQAEMLANFMKFIYVIFKGAKFFSSNFIKIISNFDKNYQIYGLKKKEV